MNYSKQPSPCSCIIFLRKVIILKKTAVFVALINLWAIVYYAWDFYTFYQETSFVTPMFSFFGGGGTDRREFLMVFVEEAFPFAVSAACLLIPVRTPGAHVVCKGWLFILGLFVLCSLWQFCQNPTILKHLHTVLFCILSILNFTLILLRIRTKKKIEMPPSSFLRILGLLCLFSSYNNFLN